MPASTASLRAFFSVLSTRLSSAPSTFSVSPSHERVVPSLSVSLRLAHSSLPERVVGSAPAFVDRGGAACIRTILPMFWASRHSGKGRAGSDGDPSAPSPGASPNTLAATELRRPVEEAGAGAAPPPDSIAFTRPPPGEPSAGEVSPSPEPILRSLPGLPGLLMGPRARVKRRASVRPAVGERPPAAECKAKDLRIE